MSGRQVDAEQVVDAVARLWAATEYSAYLRHYLPAVALGDGRRVELVAAAGVEVGEAELALVNLMAGEPRGLADDGHERRAAVWRRLAGARENGRTRAADAVTAHMPDPGAP